MCDCRRENNSDRNDECRRRDICRAIELVGEAICNLEEGCCELKRNDICRARENIIRGIERAQECLRNI